MLNTEGGKWSLQVFGIKIQHFFPSFTKLLVLMEKILKNMCTRSILSIQQLASACTLVQ